MLLNGKGPRNVEAQPDACIRPFVVGAQEKLWLGESLRIGQEHLKNVAAGLDVPADTECIVVFGARVAGGSPAVFNGDGAALRDLKTGRPRQYNSVVEVWCVYDTRLLRRAYLSKPFMALSGSRSMV